MGTKEYYKEQPYTWQSNKDRLFENAVNVQFESILKRLPLLERENVILDVGCGEGAFLDYYRGEAGYIGVDISVGNIDSAKRNHGNRGHFIVGDITSLSLEDNMADVVVCSEVAEHLTCKELECLLSEIKRVTKPGGYIIITTPNLLYLWAYMPWSIIPLKRRLTLGRLLVGLFIGYANENYNLPVHHYRFLPSYFRSLCEKYFSVLSLDTTFWYNNRAIHSLYPDVQLRIQKFSVENQLFGLGLGAAIVVLLVNN